ncbi:MAG: hypothetical protein J6K64_01565 [Clostridia bacterium]|nr:hypothetical protein [Clostridia bacterium]MBQ3128990.1 hypothetical protein [Clostridia bacterium]
MRKVYVDVTLKQDKYGTIVPLSVTWEDGTKYEIDRVLDVRRAAATKVGGTGVRFTVRILGRETYLFDDGERWFVEAKDGF